MRQIIPPPTFNYQAVIDSHGWRNLAPYHYDKDTRTLTRTQELRDGGVCQLQFSSLDNHLIEIENLSGTLSDEQWSEVEIITARIFNLDWDLSAFYQQMQSMPRYRWIVEQGVGQILACPTIWEDTVKTLYTTNTTWGNTIAMTQRTVDIHPDGAFPTPQQLAQLTQDQLHNQIRAGYRSQYLYELVQQIVSGEVNLESWRNYDSPTLYKAIRSLKGFGDYAAATILRVMGRFDRLAIDTVARSAYRQLTGQPAENDKVIREYYQRFGDYQGLVLWMDCIRPQDQL